MREASMSESFGGRWLASKHDEDVIVIVSTIYVFTREISKMRRCEDGKIGHGPWVRVGVKIESWLVGILLFPPASQDQHTWRDRDQPDSGYLHSRCRDARITHVEIHNTSVTPPLPLFSEASHRITLRGEDGECECWEGEEEGRRGAWGDTCS
ncbi:hypothetical protein BD410DRAFT_831514 [Rickenella mellea]|uniref:Uncharacterized protein n=1 Tax=Rickenella mellea TaxID=50990 RepID=A0A4Y7PR84_9AGAM|nr:hypothetical protein BD410DRAFT_831514 [Rickenella mellea]